MGIVLPICCITGRIAGDRFACGDCDPCLAAHVVPPVIKRLMEERDEFANKYEEAMMELEELKYQSKENNDANDYFALGLQMPGVTE